MSHKIRIIAFYLPQFHPIPENDEWWGRGFTEWTNVAKALPLFKGHYQPHIPADLGFYDLRVPETRQAQAEMANEYGVEGFCYYHYWFNGKRLLERPFNEVLKTKNPDFPFCLCWANETWSGVWHGNSDRVLIEQIYSGIDDYRKHFFCLLEAFTDSRYIQVYGKPLLLIYKPWQIPDVKNVIDFWRELSLEVGLKGLHIVSAEAPRNENEKKIFDGFVQPSLGNWGYLSDCFFARMAGKIIQRYKSISRRIRRLPRIVEYEKVCLNLLAQDASDYILYQCLLPNWDNTPRSGERGVVLHNSTPELFEKQVVAAIRLTKQCTADERIIFVKSWNEWAEGNHLEPDLKYGKAYLEVLKRNVIL